MIHTIQHFFSESIWRRDFTKRSRLLAFVVQQIKTVWFLIQLFFEDKLLVRASALTYSTLLAIVPLLVILFLVFKSMGLYTELIPILTGWLAPLGPNGEVVATQLMNFIANAQTDKLGVFGIIALLFSAISILNNIEGSYNDIWHVRHTRSWQHRVANHFTLLMITPLMVTLIFALTASISSETLVAGLFNQTDMQPILAFALALSPYILSGLLFMIMIWFVPNTPVSFKAALIGGVFSGIGWQALNWGFAQFVVGATQGSTRDILFAGFAALPLFLLWVYLGWVVILLGVELSYVMQHIGVMEWRELEKRYGATLRRYVGLRALLEIVQQFAAHGGGLTLKVLAKEIRVPEPVLDQIIEPIVSARILTPTKDEPPQYVLARDPHLITVADVLQVFRGETSLPERLEPIDESGAYVERMLQEIDDAIAAGPGSVSLHGAAIAAHPDSEIPTADLIKESVSG